MTPYDTQLQHLLRMARIPGAKAYAWARAQELDRDESGLWTGIAEHLKSEMARSPASTSQDR